MFYDGRTGAAFLWPGSDIFTQACSAWFGFFTAVAFKSFIWIIAATQTLELRYVIGKWRQQLKSALTIFRRET
jgi:hypothetical protein